MADIPVKKYRVRRAKKWLKQKLLPKKNTKQLQLKLKQMQLQNPIIPLRDKVKKFLDGIWENLNFG